MASARRRDWSWECEDELEAYGLELVLERAGVSTERQRDRAHLRLVAQDGTDEAERLTAAMLRHHAKVDDGETAKRLARREHTGRTVLVVLAAIGCVSSLIAFLSSF